MHGQVDMSSAATATVPVPSPKATSNGPSPHRLAAVHPRCTAAAVLSMAAGLAAVALLAAAAVLMASTAIASSVPSLNPLPPPALAATSATITPSLSPDRLRARAALTLTIHYAGGEFNVPSPVRRSVLRLPAGMSLEVPSLHSCSAARLRARGARGCPARSRLGGGHALVEAHAGSQTITEDVALSAFLGPPRNLEPTFEVLAQGYSPLEKRVVFTGSVLSDGAPYGEQLVMSIPPISTLPLESDASIVTFSLTVGASRGRRRDQSTVRVPSSCPAGGFPFAAQFTYADGSNSSALARIPCPS